MFTVKKLAKLVEGDKVCIQWKQGGNYRWFTAEVTQVKQRIIKVVFEAEKLTMSISLTTGLATGNKYKGAFVYATN